MVEMKKIINIFVGILFCWFTLDITGFKIRDFNLVVSAIKDEPIDILWLLIFAVVFLLFIFKEKIGKYALSIFMSIWSFIQFSMYFKTQQQIESYNIFFAKENTNYIIKPLNTFLIKDTYHMILDLLIAISLSLLVVFIIKSIKEKSNKS